MFLLLRGFLLTSFPSLFTLNLKSAFSLQKRLGSVGNLPRRRFGATCCACVSFAWEIVRDSPMVNFVSQTMNKYIKMRPGHRQRSLCCLVKENAPWRHWRIPSIYSERDLWSLEFRSWLRPRAVSLLRVRFALQDYKVATLGAPRRDSLGIIHLKYFPDSDWLKAHV